MKKKEPISSIMTTHIYTVHVKDSLLKVQNLITDHNIRHVPVLHDGKLVGIISKTDLNRLSFSGFFAGQEEADEAIFDMLSIAQVMSHKPRVVKASTSIHDVAKILSKEEFHALPVVDDQDTSKLVGIVTTTDVIRYMLENFL